MLGRFGRRNPVDTLREVTKDTQNSKHWQWLGAMGIFAGFLVLSYYSVIAGWAISYFFKSLSLLVLTILVPMKLKHFFSN